MQSGEFVAQWIKCGTIFNTCKDRVVIGWGPRIWSVDPARAIVPSFYFPDYFLKSLTPWYSHPYYLEISIQELQKHLSAFLIPERKVYQWTHSHKEFFYKIFDDLQRKIKNEELAKAVPFIIESANEAMSSSQLAQSLNEILSYIQQNAAHLYGFWDEREGILGASPEFLFRVNAQRVLETMACAGTRPLQKHHQGFLPDSKEFNEHELVVRGIKESLSPYGRVAIGDLSVLKLSGLAHLVTSICLELNKSLHFSQIVDILHPTPAVGAFPKKEGHFWLEEYQQKIDRKRFGAPVGYLLPDTQASNCYVAIRNVQWWPGQMQIAAGCGVIAESQCDKEWEEINLKLKVIKEMLAL